MTNEAIDQLTGVTCLLRQTPVSLSGIMYVHITYMMPSLVTPHDLLLSTTAGRSTDKRC